MVRIVLTLVLFVTLAVNRFGIAVDPSPESDSEPRHAEEDPNDRSSSASAQAYVYIPPIPTVMAQKLVQCVTCSGCPMGKNATTKYCPVSSNPLKNGRCVVYSEKYSYMKNPWVVRGCASERGNCADIRDAYSRQSSFVQLLSCADCEGDRCNGAGYSSLDLLAALTAVVIMPLLMKSTLA